MKKIGNYGGCLLNPPEACKYKFNAHDGGRWCDLANCQRSCNEQCDHYLKYKKMRPRQKDQFLVDNGVRLTYFDPGKSEESKEIEEVKVERPQSKYKRRD